MVSFPIGTSTGLDVVAPMIRGLLILVTCMQLMVAAWESYLFFTRFMTASVLELAGYGLAAVLLLTAAYLTAYDPKAAQ